MEAKELRIGNYVLNEGVVTTFDMGDWDCVSNRIFSQTPMERYAPIPLTEEWLVKFGFKIKKGEATIKSCNSLMLDTIDMACSFGGDYDIVDIKYVHQLQNLYFALTGEELI